LQLTWKYDQESINWEKLSNLYKIAPLGEKKPMIFRKLLVIVCINALYLKALNWLV
jgi:hypothetical protein